MSEDQNGFEYQGRFYPWAFNNNLAKDLMLVDRIAKMPAAEFINLIVDADGDNIRTPVLLAIIATSFRAAHPEWTLDRIERLVMGLDLAEDITHVSAEEDEPSPPAETGPPTSEAGRSPSNGSSPPSIPQESSTSETFYGIPV